MAQKKVKPAKVNLKRDKNESSNDYKIRVAKAEREAFEEAARINAEIARQQGRNPAPSDEQPAGRANTVSRRGIFGRSYRHGS